MHHNVNNNNATFTDTSVNQNGNSIKITQTSKLKGHTINQRKEQLTGIV